ncbi:MAG: ribose-5-phosphate isomerase RpiA [Spirochaetota bacterium]
MCSDDAKRAAGYAAADRFVTSNMRVGMGTGSTAVWALRRIGERLAAGEISDVVGVATSSQAELECNQAGIPLRSMNDPEIDGVLDVTIDGADEIDPDRRLIKGGGGALLMEKIVAYASKRFVVVACESKLVDHLGTGFPLPVEVLPFARMPVLKALEKLGARAEVRRAERKMGAVITDNGNIIVDVTFAEPIDPVEMETELVRIPGVLGNGLFTRVDPLVLVGREDGSVTTLGG